MLSCFKTAPRKKTKRRTDDLPRPHQIQYSDATLQPAVLLIGAAAAELQATIVYIWTARQLKTNTAAVITIIIIIINSIIILDDVLPIKMSHFHDNACLLCLAAASVRLSGLSVYYCAVVSVEETHKNCRIHMMLAASL